MLVPLLLLAWLLAPLPIALLLGSAIRWSRQGAASPLGADLLDERVDLALAA